MELDFSADAIDAMVIQLDQAFTMAGDKMPEKVKTSGKAFMADLSEWADQKRAESQKK